MGLAEIAINFVCLLAEPVICQRRAAVTGGGGTAIPSFLQAVDYLAVLVFSCSLR